MPGETHRTIVIAGSQQAAIQRCQEIHIDPKARTTILATPSSILFLRKVTLRVTDDVTWGYTGDAKPGEIVSILQALRIEGYVE
jgi:hypothetical protein